MPEHLPTRPNGSGTGKPEYTDEVFQRWLDDMRPFLRQGSSLNYAMEKSGILNHEYAIRSKYKSTDPADVWFARKVDALRSTVGELINNVGFLTIEAIHNRMITTDGKVGILSSDELQVWKVMAEKHRSAQPFFVNRTETAEADDSKLGKIIESLDTETDYDELANEAKKQILAANSPVQDQGQVGQSGDVQTQPSATDAPGGAQSTPV